MIEIGSADNDRAAMQRPQPGDTLILDDGTCAVSSHFSLALHGTRTQPMIIRAGDGAHPLISCLNNTRNILNIIDSTFLAMDSIELSGGSRAIRCMGVRRQF
ncbi:MAG TPA: hypothetical protein VFN13_04685 [Rudaea sp.]|nr:hypothetical protein [Rudaea sp.]